MPADGASDPGLRLHPVRGVRYRPGTDLAAVTAPPYDVLDRASAVALEAADPHNVIRLVQPFTTDRAARDAEARATLDGWLADGTLLVDPTPALYVYDQSGPAGAVRGLVGAVELTGAVLPHEDVMPGPVADRAALQAALEAHVEPIWLLYDGGGAATAVVERTVAGAPLAEARTEDGVGHRLWAITDPDELTAIEVDLAGRQALIADGHHRFAAYQRVRDGRRAGGQGGGPWDRGLALLVDVGTHAPRVAAIHRVVRSADGHRLLDAVRADPLVRLDPLDRTTARPDHQPQPETALLVAGDGAEFLLTLPTASERARWFAGDQRPARWHALDTAVLHEVLLPRWGVDESAISYHHTADGALAAAAVDDAVAVLLAPVTVDDVLELAAQGVRMPRKSTSFGPKPRSGFVMRTFDADRLRDRADPEPAPPSIRVREEPT